MGLDQGVKGARGKGEKGGMCERREGKGRETVPHPKDLELTYGCSEPD